MPKQYKEEFKRQVVAYYCEHGRDATCNHFGIAPTTVNKYAKAAGKTKVQLVTQEVIDQIRVLGESGKSAPEIAEILGRSQSSIRGVCKRNGIPYGPGQTRKIKDWEKYDWMFEEYDSYEEMARHSPYSSHAFRRRAQYLGIYKPHHQGANIDGLSNIKRKKLLTLWRRPANIDLLLNEIRRAS